MSLPRLYKYHDTVNRQYITSLAEHRQQVPERVLRLFSHVLNAHAVWAARIQGQPAPVGVWEVHPTARLLDVHAAAQAETDAILTQADSLDRIVAYTNSKGISYHNRVSDILLHIVNHATYHRGQVAQAMSAIGLPMPSSDYVIMLREAPKQ